MPARSCARAEPELVRHASNLSAPAKCWAKARATKRWKTYPTCIGERGAAEHGSSILSMLWPANSRIPLRELHGVPELTGTPASRLCGVQALCGWATRIQTLGMLSTCMNFFPLPTDFFFRTPFATSTFAVPVHLQASHRPSCRTLRPGASPATGATVSRSSSSELARALGATTAMMPLQRETYRLHTELSGSVRARGACLC